MKKRKHFSEKYKRLFKQHPIVTVPVVAILCFGLFVVVEQVRASWYLQKVEAYKKSTRVESVANTISQLASSIEERPPAIFCDLSTDNLLADFNEAYNSAGQTRRQANELLKTLNEGIETIQPAPGFYTLATFMSKPNEAKETSSEVRASVSNLRDLSRVDVRGDYCQSLQSVLSEIYFLNDLQKPEGVSVLLPGQLENFQVNVTTAKQQLIELRFPDVFRSEHESLLQLLSQIETDLRGNDNNYQDFSRTIEKDVEQISVNLDSIRSKTSDLQDRPALLELFITGLQED